MGHKQISQGGEWDRDATCYEAMVNEGEQKIAELIKGFEARGLPAGAVIEIEFVV